MLTSRTELCKKQSDTIWRFIDYGVGITKNRFQTNTAWSEGYINLLYVFPIFDFSMIECHRIQGYTKG